MLIRTFKQTGLSYGSEPTMIVAKVDGVVVYEGPVATVDAPFPFDHNDVSGEDLFSWTSAIDFVGTQALEITVVNNALVLTLTLANYIGSGTREAPVSGSDSHFSIQSPNSDGFPDPFSDVTINYVPQVVERSVNPSDTGQWRWVIKAGKTFRCNFTVQPPTLPA
jgi:hypothetical protein